MITGILIGTLFGGGYILLGFLVLRQVMRDGGLTTYRRLRKERKERAYSMLARTYVGAILLLAGLTLIGLTIALSLEHIN